MLLLIVLLTNLLFVQECVEYLFVFGRKNEIVICQARLVRLSLLAQLG